MNRYVRQPVRRPRVENYLLITLLTFAFTVSLTRLFLAATGYPQLGGEGLHISHVLWGGLLLFLAAMLPLILANRWVYRVSAIFAGAGIGLFIDEVGKFITQSYDYFFPPAAPIVYAFFLICVLLYLQIAKPRQRSPRGELYHALEMMQEFLDHDLDAAEQRDIHNRLSFVLENSDNPEFIKLAADLLDFFQKGEISLAPMPSSRWQNLEKRLQKFEAGFLTQTRLKRYLVYGLALLGIASVILPIFSLISTLSNFNPEPDAEFYWYIAIQFLLMMSGILLIYGMRIFTSRDEAQGLRIGYITLLVYLTMVDLFLFYFFQFATIFAALFQFVLLLGILHYQRSYLDLPRSDSPAE
ncbi:MAG: hypothetical protein JSV42_09840 [Chloroflexota bacterium]|nr:MAG: hypothetical protein JSV42_09840 [Chloroflexota bacterium]